MSFAPLTVGLEASSVQFCVLEGLCSDVTELSRLVLLSTTVSAALVSSRAWLDGINAPHLGLL